MNKNEPEHTEEIRKILPAEFPALLREIPDPPTHLYVRGALPNEDEKSTLENAPVFLCVVGARNYSAYGKDVCESLIAELARAPQIRRPDGTSRIVIVSGLALGIDAIAHKAALNAGLKTIALPGSGLAEEVLYPKANHALAHRILENGGALVSEFEPATQARPEFFPQRNRLMAGLSHAVLIVEAERQSGTMITARLATDYNRDVLTIPGSIFSRHTAGPHLLLGLGARPVTCAGDILDTLKLVVPEELKPTVIFGEKSHKRKRKRKTRENADSENLRLRFPAATPDELVILDLLAIEPLSKDDLIERSGLSTSRVSIALSLLELAGHIKESLGLVRRM